LTAENPEAALATLLTPLDSTERSEAALATLLTPLDSAERLQVGFATLLTPLDSAERLQVGFATLLTPLGSAERSEGLEVGSAERSEVGPALAALTPLDSAQEGLEVAEERPEVGSAEVGYAVVWQAPSRLSSTGPPSFQCSHCGCQDD